MASYLCVAPIPVFGLLQEQFNAVRSPPLIPPPFVLPGLARKENKGPTGGFFHEMISS
jgi:hypothetical protein